MFDFANPDLHIPQRSETTVPQQSLFLMNHPIVLERAKTLAKTVAEVSDPAEQIRQLYLRTLQRPPSPAQLEDALQLVREESPEAEKPVLTAADWAYGYGAIDETTQKITSFTPLPHFSGSAWQGGPAFPDGPLGWVQLSAVGGHPGNDRQHAVIRRWTAPRAMTISVKSELIHEPDPGDGVRAFIVSSRSGVHQSAKAHKQTVAMNVDSIAVEPGDTLDFLVDIGDVLNSDQYFWRCQLASASGENAVAEATNVEPLPAKWNSESDFPRNTVNLLTPLEQLAQVLMCSNEFMFVD